MKIDPPLLTFQAPDRNDTSEKMEQWVRSIADQLRIKVDALLKGRESIVVGIGGGSATGKTSLFSRTLFDTYSPAVIRQDGYYVGNTLASRYGSPNVHDPDNYQIETIARHMALLRSGMPIIKPKYSHVKREPEGEEVVQPTSVIVLEGMHSLHDALASHLDYGVFIDTDDHSRFTRRMIRPRRNPQQSDLPRVAEYFALSFPYYHSHVLPTRKNADAVITNTYHPQEGNERLETAVSEVNFVGNKSLLALFHSRYPAARPQKYSFSYYSHSCAEESETIAMLHYEKSDNELVYSSGGTCSEQGIIVSPSVVFALQNETFDLRNIGYLPECTRNGVVWSSTTNEGIDARCYLCHGKFVLQLSTYSQRTNDENIQDFLLQLANIFQRENLPMTNASLHQLMKAKS